MKITVKAKVCRSNFIGKIQLIFWRIIQVVFLIILALLIHDMQIQNEKVYRMQAPT
tara:strand:- start:2 stop:169 length:168 start_codon:yes stop_codon:yes gene_type:complete